MAAAPQSAHDFSFRSITGGDLPLAGFKGKAVLVVNVASQCGLTPQYAGLERLWQTYGKQGLVVLGVPSNDFGGQEPGTEAEIKTFCETKYRASFPMTAKEKVIGGAAHPFYRWIATEIGDAATPKWNFHKYLIGKNGELVGVFGSRTEPNAAEIEDAIKEAIA